MEEIAFIDLEASGLSAASWPIEVGWCGLAGEPTTFLIQPDERWPAAAWDARAEALHGVSLERLRAEGAPAAETAKELNASLSGMAVYSDAPDWDAFWLYRLFDAARTRQAFALLDFSVLFEEVAPDAFSEALRRTRAERPHRHRARDDVLHMRTLYALTRDER